MTDPSSRKQPVSPQATTNRLSRQRRWQLARRSKHLCIICGAPAVTSTRCLRHAIAVRERERQTRGWKRRNGSLTYRLATTALVLASAPLALTFRQQPMLRQCQET